MARSRKRGGGRVPRASKRGVSPRRTGPQTAVRRTTRTRSLARTGDRSLPGITRPRYTSQNKSRAGNYGLQFLLDNRRRRLQASKLQARTRLSGTILPARRNNEDAPLQKASRTLCARSKAARRAVIIATGYGGKNGRTRYAPHQRCKK